MPVFFINCHSNYQIVTKLIKTLIIQNKNNSCTSNINAQTVMVIIQQTKMNIIVSRTVQNDDEMNEIEVEKYYLSEKGMMPLQSE